MMAFRKALCVGTTMKEKKILDTRTEQNRKHGFRNSKWC